MKSILLMVICMLFFTFSGFAQDLIGQNMKVETTDAHYPGGDQALTDFLLNNMKYTEEAKSNKVQGDLMVSFYVETDSSVSYIKIISDNLGHGCAESLKNVLVKMKFAPALVNGVPMKSKMMVTVPVRAH